MGMEAEDEVEENIIRASDSLEFLLITTALLDCLFLPLHFSISPSYLIVLLLHLKPYLCESPSISVKLRKSLSFSQLASIYFREERTR